MFKYAICNETFQDWSFDRAFAFARECGYTGLEIAPFTLAEYATQVSAEQRRQVRRQAEQAGLEIIGLHWLLAKTEGFYLTSPEAAVRSARPIIWRSWRNCAAIWAARSWCWARRSNETYCPALPNRRPCSMPPTC